MQTDAHSVSPPRYHQKISADIPLGKEPFDLGSIAQSHARNVSAAHSVYSKLQKNEYWLINHCRLALGRSPASA
jgi:hypothetical protein